MAYLHLTLTHSNCYGQIVKVKVLHISTVNIVLIVTDRENVTITIRYAVVYRLSIGIYVFDLDPF